MNLKFQSYSAQTVVVVVVAAAALAVDVVVGTTGCNFGGRIDFHGFELGLHNFATELHNSGIIADADFVVDIQNCTVAHASAVLAAGASHSDTFAKFDFGYSAVGNFDCSIHQQNADLKVVTLACFD